MKQNKLSQHLEQVRKDIRSENTGDLAGEFLKENVQSEVVTSRVISEDAAHYILVKGLRKVNNEETADDEAVRKFDHMGNVDAFSGVTSSRIDERFLLKKFKKDHSSMSKSPPDGVGLAVWSKVDLSSDEDCEDGFQKPSKSSLKTAAKIHLQSSNTVDIPINQQKDLPQESLKGDQDVPHSSMKGEQDVPHSSMKGEEDESRVSTEFEQDVSQMSMKHQIVPDFDPNDLDSIDENNKIDDRPQKSFQVNKFVENRPIKNMETGEDSGTDSESQGLFTFSILYL